MRLWILTNGYGEDRAGAIVGAELLARRPEMQVAAATLVTPGAEFSSCKIRVDLSGSPPRSGGFPAAGLRTLIGDLPAISGYIAFAQRLRRLASCDDPFVAVGDVFLAGLGRFAFRKRGVHIALAKSIHGRPHSRLECALLRRWTRLVLARDEATATNLRSKGVRAAFVGNPLIDRGPAPAAAVTAGAHICKSPENGPGPCSPYRARVLLLPGSRSEAPENLAKLLDLTLAVSQPAAWACAWPDSVPIERGMQAAMTAGWKVRGDALTHEDRVVTIATGRFDSLLEDADIVIGLAGTANERAAAAGKPVVTFVGCGPQTTPARMREQERLLGGAVEFVPGGTVAVAAAVARLIQDGWERIRRGALGVARLGAQGGAGRIADAIIQEIGL